MHMHSQEGNRVKPGHRKRDILSAIGLALWKTVNIRRRGSIMCFWDGRFENGAPSSLIPVTPTCFGSVFPEKRIH